MSKILVMNCGSSSVKFQVLQMPEENVLAKGVFERIGLDQGHYSIQFNETEKLKEDKNFSNHEEAIQLLGKKLLELKIIESYSEIQAVGHRVVHGGEKFHDAVVITDKVIADIEACTDLAPLHNPANLTGIFECQKLLPNTPAVAVFDTAFHQTMPESSYLYSLPYEYYEKYGIRKYGFHGSSHKYVTQRAAELLQRPIEQLRLISCHIGNGVSIAAVEGGKSIDTSMGFTPLAGVAMGTRSGNIDPALIPFIMDKTGKTANEVVFDILNRKSGMLGVSGISSDLRDIEDAAQEKIGRAETALEIFASRIHKYLGSYTARMYGVDAIIFTAGVGENSSVIREKVLKGLEFMGVYWDPALNKVRGKEAFVNYPHSPVKVIVIPTNEEVMIARDAIRVLANH
ncbi:acetate kinase [Bacillus horti]|uniref:Acetate kinase n=1 Tax=Caldalkalibacillus horti TaxID=77523 RepID=A0ABT9W5K6_9BACI|nr:acetate kinase [Bacillus horti]MDQ0168120.1 acetate kinase [Bacillus horti]